MPNQVPEDVVKNRFDRLLREVQDIAAEVVKRHEGTVQKVLVEEIDTHDGPVFRAEEVELLTPDEQRERIASGIMIKKEEQA